MESRKISGFPQVPLCHIVTSLILFIIRNIHTPTCTPTYLWISPKELPAVVNYRSTKGREGGRGALINGWMDPEEPEGEVNLKCWADVPSTLPPNALEWVLCHVSSFYGPLSKVFWFLPSVFNTGLQCCWTVSQSSVIFEFNIKCGTRWQTLWGKSKEIRITLMLELLSSWERIKKKEEPGQNGASCSSTPTTCWSSPFYPHTPTISGKTEHLCDLLHVLPMFPLRRVDNT